MTWTNELSYWGAESLDSFELAISPDGLYLALSELDIESKFLATVTIFDTESGEVVNSFSLPQQISVVIKPEVSDDGIVSFLVEPS